MIMLYKITLQTPTNKTYAHIIYCLLYSLNVLSRIYVGYKHTYIFIDLKNFIDDGDQVKIVQKKCIYIINTITF